MVSVLLSWVYMGCLTFLYGLGTVGWLRRLSEEGEIPLSVVALVGLAEVAAVTGYLSLLMPIGLGANLAVWAVGSGLGWGSGRFKAEVGRAYLRLQKLGPWYLGVLAVLAAVLSFTSVGKPWILKQFFNYDSGLYHIPSIQWIEQYGTVSGLGNLMATLSIDSLWFQLYALFSFAWALKHPLHAVLGFVVFWACCFGLGGLRTVLTGGRARASDLFRVLTLVPLLELAGNPAAPTTDEPAAILVLIVLALTCRQIEEKGDDRVLQTAIALLALFAVGIKLSVLPLLLVVVALGWKQVRKEGLRALAGYGLLTVGMLAPRIVRSTILSGYPVYPLFELNPFAFDWKLPQEVLVWEKKSLESWAKMQFRSPDKVLEGGFWYWFPSWFENFKTTPIAQGLLLSLGIFVLTGVFAFARQWAVLSRYRLIYLTAGAGMVYWFVAPFLRYGYGFLAAMAILLVLPAALIVADRLPFKQIGALRPDFWAASAVAVLLLITEGEKVKLGTGINFTQHYLETLEQLQSGYLPRRLLFYQADYPSIETQGFQMGNFRLYRPATGQQCWNAPLPCTPYLHRRVELRGPSLKDGFRVQPGSLAPLGPFDGNRFNKAVGTSD